MEENFTPSELWLAMTMTYMCDDGCPLTYFDKSKKDLPFCEGKIVREDEDGELDEPYVECPKGKGNDWLAKVGPCWVRYARMKAKSSDAKEVADQVWEEHCEERR